MTAASGANTSETNDSQVVLVVDAAPVEAAAENGKKVVGRESSPAAFETPLDPTTALLYLTYDGNFELECTAQVTNVVQQHEEEEPSVAVASLNEVVLSLNQTVLHAQGGGQPTDTGWIRGETSKQELRVTKVLLDRATGVVTHSGTLAKKKRDAGDSTSATVDGVGGGGGGCFEVGETVHVTVDAENRQILSECHTAGHVVDSAMAQCGKFLKPSKAYHFLDGPYVEYEGSIPVHERESLLKDLQSAFTQLIDQDIATEIQILNQQDADSLCNRQAQNFNVDVFRDNQGQVRVVTVAGFPCPCGGTHVRSTGQLKTRQWGITGLKCKKNVVRVKYGYKQDPSSK